MTLLVDMLRPSKLVLPNVYQLRVAFFGPGAQSTSSVTSKVQTQEEEIIQGSCLATENVDQVGKSDLYHSSFLDVIRLLNHHQFFPGGSFLRQCSSWFDQVEPSECFSVEHNESWFRGVQVH